MPELSPGRLHSLNVVSYHEPWTPSRRSMGSLFTVLAFAVLIIHSRGSNETLGQRPYGFVWLITTQLSGARQPTPCSLEVASSATC